MSLVVIVVIVMLLGAIALMPGYTPRIKPGGNIQEGESIASLEKLTVGNSV